MLNPCFAQTHEQKVNFNGKEKESFTKGSHTDYQVSDAYVSHSECYF